MDDSGGASTRVEEPDSDIYHFPEFFERLQQRGAMPTRDAIQSETELDGLLYHHRGVQIPAESATFVWDPETESVPVFRLEVNGLGARIAGVAFDATKSWDVYLARFDGGAIVSWMTDEEFETDESERFPSKASAIRSGRFSFGTFFVFGPDWIEREEWAVESSAPGMIQYSDGSVIDPATEEEFYQLTPALPSELRREDPSPAPDHLGLVDVELELQSE